MKINELQPAPTCCNHRNRVPIPAATTKLLKDLQTTNLCKLAFWRPFGVQNGRQASTRRGSLTNASGLQQKRSRRDHGASLAESRLLLDGAGLPTCPEPRNTCLDATCSNREPKPSRDGEPCYPLDRPHGVEEAVAPSLFPSLERAFPQRPASLQAPQTLKMGLS